MVRSGDYYLFETDSEEEEDDDNKDEDDLRKKSAFQVGLDQEVYALCTISTFFRCKGTLV